ncbi:MAG: hypothetical protein GKR87_02025 [Kiritimatiellae bacterium]|nr:hypothetical protein [Kiritimatiellia bacterium]
MKQQVHQRGLSDSVRYLKDVGSARAEQFAHLGLHTVHDLLYFLPREYEDRRKTQKISELRSGMFSTVKGEVIVCDWVKPNFGKRFFQAVIGDESGLVTCKWYGTFYLQDQLKRGDPVTVYGKVSKYKGHYTLQHPEIEPVDQDNVDAIYRGHILPIYPGTENLSQRVFQKIMGHVIEHYVDLVEETLPKEMLTRNRFPSITQALSEVHFPETFDRAKHARTRLIFEEFLCVQLVLVGRKTRAERVLEGHVYASKNRLKNKLLDRLSFELTTAQKRVICELEENMKSTHPMHRLLQARCGVRENNSRYVCDRKCR